MTITSQGKDGVVIDVRLFGSAARGDSDERSDIDVLVVTEAGKPDIEVLKASLFDRIKANVDVSVYSINRLRMMFSEGHMFSWHLYQESRRLEYRDTVDLLALLGKPNPYRSAHKDVSELLDLLETIKDEVKNTSSLTFEAGLLYVCARNIALSASWYTEDGIKFGRNSPFELTLGKLAFPLSRADYDILVACRHASTRGEPTEAPPRDWLAERAEICHQWACQVHELIPEWEHVN
ncbi:nucleotidyltransferase domain-containing protein [Burkholderia cepacia]|uniref:nucleotidyltransferase domain-containing protein n=1 Tax=Burkholderia cepacia TaxID=292 RepID=UPI00265529F9|nr:nucleotidyltransferase domain-containing protein [Burkholderia cepacia]MDN7892970.1 nucleotidyltransferase domain-containing protein [Burkholderia cepacia]